MPYPGRRPDFSFVHDDATGWRVSDLDLNDWLASRDAAPLAERVPVLCYGSNVCPSKITWLRTELGLPGPAILLRAECTGLAAVWAAGLRVVDDQRPATLAAAPGVREYHAIWLATQAQVAVLDRCEGRGERYRLARVYTGEVRLEDGTVIHGPLAYTAAAARRRPLLVNGMPVRCADVPQTEAAGLTGSAAITAAITDGLTVHEITGTPEQADFPYAHQPVGGHGHNWR